MNGLIEELKRRNVFRVGIAYVVVSWLIVQVVDTIAGPLSLPEWLPAVVIVLLLVGFPMALLLAWAFELTPEGIKRSEDVVATDSITASTGQKLNYMIIGTLVIALGFFAWERQRLVEKVEQSQVAGMQAATDDQESSTGETQRASIAVLPFVNMSDDASQEHFSDGISEELLNVLAKVPEFRVAARTSSFQFKGRNLDIADVASQLNVEHVIEGSVRRAGNTVRITAQLIEADSGFHVWSESYDRQLDDVFKIQDEISGAIVAALSETLGLASAPKAPLVEVTTSDQNYNDYLLARELIRQRNEVDLSEARDLLVRVTTDDPDFAPAFVQLAKTWYLLSDTNSTYGSLPVSVTVPKAMSLLDRAFELEPDDPEALGVRGLVLFDATGDGVASLEIMRRSLELNPSQTDVRAWYANSLMFTGRYEEADRQLAIGLEYDPLSMLLLMNYAYRLVGAEDLDRLQPVIDRVTRLDPARASALQGELAEKQGRRADALVHFLEAMDQAPGESQHRIEVGEQFLALRMTDEARRLLVGPDDEFWIAYAENDYQRALEIAQARMREVPEDFAVRYLDNVAMAYFDLAVFDKAIENGLQGLDAMPDEIRPFSWANYTVAASLMMQGDREQAVPLLERFIASTSADLDASVFSGPTRFFTLGLAQAAIGNREDALARLSYAAERAAFNRTSLDVLYQHLEFDKDEAFEAVVRRADERWNEEQALLRAAICVEGRFDTWQPLESTCANHSESAPTAAEST